MTSDGIVEADFPDFEARQRTPELSDRRGFARRARCYLPENAPFRECRGRSALT